MFTPATCQDKPILGLVDYTKFKLESSMLIAAQFSQHQAAWDAFCQHVDTSTLNQTNRLMLMKVAFDCMHEHCNARELAKLLTLAQYLRDGFGAQLFYMVFSNRVNIESRVLENYVTACQLLIDLGETSGLTDLVKQAMPNLNSLVPLLEEKQASYLAEKYPGRAIHEVIARFAEKDNLIQFPLNYEELERIKEEYIAISSLITSLRKLSTADLKEQALQHGSSWNDKKEIEHKHRVIAIIAELIRRHYKILPHDTQVLAFIALINTPNDLKGRIAQIKTGEGKSTIIAMLAAYEVCLGQDVDIVTSSSYLAIRDQEKYKPFFKSLGFDCTHICEELPTSEQFKAKIIYGTNTDFEFAMLRDKLYCLGLRGSRQFHTVIVDEVDNLFLDTALNSAILAVPGTEDRSWIYHPILSFAKNSPIDTPVTKLREYLQSTLDPQYQEQLKHISDEQLHRWLISANEAIFTKDLGRDYLVKEISTGIDIVIVDYKNTGRLNEGCHWQNGMHQFLQAKHGLKITPESLSVASLSHPTYFTQYGHIIGLTGTMGDAVEREEIQRIYNVGSFDVPPHYPSLRKKVPIHIKNSSDDQFGVLLEKARAMKHQGRPVLILMKTIADSVKLNEFFVKAGITPQLINLTQREDEEYLISQAGEPGKITIATNAAGRGTDIILAPDSKAAGGLCFIFGFYPQNSRVEAQGDGRAARQGQPGDCQMILNENDDYIISLRKRAIASFSQFLENIASWGLMNADEKLELLNSLRSSLIKIESEQRYLSCKKEELYFEKLNVFFERNQALYQALHNESLLKSLSQTCESTHHFSLSKPTADLSSLIRAFEPLQEIIDALMINQVQNIKVDWAVLIKQYKEIYIDQFQKTWAEFYDALHKDNHHTSFSDIKQTIESRYQDLDQVLKTMDANPHENINKILHVLLSASLQRLLEKVTPPINVEANPSSSYLNTKLVLFSSSDAANNLNPSEDSDNLRRRIS